MPPGRTFRPDEPLNRLTDYLDALGSRRGDKHGIIRISPDGTRQTAVAARDAVPDILQQMRREMAQANEYISPNTTNAPAGRNKGRGTEAQLARVVALLADLDVKDGACQDKAEALEIAAEIGDALGEPPTVLMDSGGGIQALWAIGVCDVPTGLAFLRRFGRLVRRIARERGERLGRSIKLDSVFDGARVFRVPGSLNWKYGDPVEVSAWHGGGSAFDPDTLDETFCGLGIESLDGDDKVGPAEVVIPEGNWRFAGESCRYSVTTIKGWLTDPMDARHPSYLCQLVRLECMRRNGCITREDYHRAHRDLEANFHKWLANGQPSRPAHHNEVSDLKDEAIRRAERKGQAEIDSELGGSTGHVHLSGGGAMPLPESPGERAAAGESGATTTASDDASSGRCGTAELVALEQDFWTSRESLRTIYSAALARKCSPWAVLACCAGRALATVRPNVVLPPVIGGKGSLNLFIAIVGKSGDGKGAANAVARELITEPVDERKPGSGEGIVRAYRTDDGHRESIVFVTNEVSTIAALKARSGSTLMSTLCEAYSGETLGFGYAAKDKDFLVPAHAYRLIFVCSVQPGRAGALLEDADAGTPQRFLWFPARDKRATREAKRQHHFPALGLTLPKASKWQYPREVILPAEAVEFIEEQDDLRNDDNPEALDGHAVFTREKFAYALTVLDGRVDMDSEDWRLSGIAAAVSDATRARVIVGLAHAERAEAQRAGQLTGVRLAAADDAKAAEEQRKVNRVNDRVVEYLGAAGDDGLTEGELNRMFNSRDRGRIDLAALAGQGRIIQIDRHDGDKTDRWRKL